MEHLHKQPFFNTGLCRCSIFGLRFFFFSDDHEPIHVHVVKGDDDAKIAILPEVRLVYNHGLKVGDINRAMKLAEMYKPEIVAAWRQYFG